MELVRILFTTVKAKSVIFYTNPFPKSEIMIWFGVVEHAQLPMLVLIESPIFQFSDPVKRAVGLKEHLRVLRGFAFPWSGGRRSGHCVLLLQWVDIVSIHNIKKEASLCV
ncbi:MAG: hypothetical protein CO030_03265 [Candidatus Magasanikbacteria bacterium CG_4_9_14_0_2_um_filter_42_11]|uniref:Uncharacterized protein n=1 Tax=Candidatus Magasanikbacteria bacterium CG_4_9_14_0_2_um_filter_42_11 TaxID=1974643 RepID=A0A2M8F9G3_9BACT|nr:MAG: hypothetical protein COU34_03180 [Candidatus Magasanikbacteria bacterium CG10_big_fil_rev_8_21_14_0_10_43_9]PJC52367.1 MAG: hypothetical protein CO030_03265 [Candidatus Magasanikbacteria bacterium CG_4_9_14_0_2_um_filter_42_11]